MTSAIGTGSAGPGSFRACPRVAGSAALALAALIIGTASIACSTPPAVNPWVDDSISSDTWGTASSEGVLAAGKEPVIRRRDVPEARAPYVKPGVPHYPLWFEDPFEDKGDGDGRFAWGWQDYFAMPYSFGRWLLNTMAWPVSAVVTPPGTPMVSDSYVGRDHDAAVGTSPNPTATRSDFGYDVEASEDIDDADMLDVSQLPEADSY